jgi:hypothetical protein
MTTMNTDDRDIVCEQDYTPLSNAELLTQIEQYTAIMYTSPIIDFDLEWITGPARALAARVAELEAASELAIDKWADAARSETQLRLDAAEARVAELEAASDAQGWRPVTEKPPAHDSYLVYRASPPQAEPWRYEFGVWDDSGWDIEAITHWRPLPPAPDAPQETTP